MAAWSPEIANEFIKLAASDSRALTQMQLQKLVFFAHGWNLAISGAPLTMDNPKAFDYGPVYQSLWEALRDHGRNKVRRLIRNGDYDIGAFSDDMDAPAKGYLTPEERGIVERVYSDYGKFEAYKLSAITHIDGSPWEQVYGLGEGKFRDIPANLIRDYFVGLAVTQRQAAHT